MTRCRTYLSFLSRTRVKALAPLAAVLLALSGAACARTMAGGGAWPGGMREQEPVGEPGDSLADDNAQGEDLGKHFVGALPESIAYYRTHGRELFRVMDSKPWHGWTRARKCVGCKDSERTKLRIQAMSNTGVDPLTGLPVNGVVVGRLRNVGPRVDEGTHAGAQIGSRRADQYYFIITDKGDSTAAKLWVAHLTFSDGVNADQSITIDTAAHDYTKCVHPAHPGAKSRGDFRTCTDSARMMTMSAPPWFSCDGGCCTTQWPP